MKSSHMKPSHMLLCAVLLVVGVVLLAGGVGAFAFLLLVVCVLMMGGMMWMMMRPGRDDRRPLTSPPSWRPAWFASWAWRRRASEPRWSG